MQMRNDGRVRWSSRAVEHVSAGTTRPRNVLDSEQQLPFTRRCGQRNFLHFKAEGTQRPQHKPKRSDLKRAYRAFAACAAAASRSRGESEVFVTQYQWLSTGPYTLQDQIHRLTGELMNLAPREVFLKIRGGKPVRTSTADLQPAFRSVNFQRVMLPAFRASCAVKSPYIRQSVEVDAEIAARFAPALPQPDKPEPETWREPFDYPDPLPPPEPARVKPLLRVVRPPNNEDQAG
jgi:hypothetical protein